MLVPHLGKSGLTMTAGSYDPNSVQPQLFITRASAGVRVLWPVGFPGWVLQSTTNLVSPAWAPVSVQCDNQAVVPAVAPQQFFRLSRQ